MSLLTGKYWRYFLAIGIAALIYIVATLFSPISSASNTYNLSGSTIHLLQLTIVIPVIVIWFVGVFGAVRFKSYTDQIQNSPDGRAMRDISAGLMTLVASLVLPTLITLLKPYYPATIPTITVVNNYLLIIILIISFYLINRGSRQLITLIPTSIRPTRVSIIVVLVIMAIVAIGYIAILLHNPYRGGTLNPQKITSYYLPDGLIIGTICIPYILTWTIGIMSAINFRSYLNGVQGTLYRQALHSLAWGVIAVILSSILLALLAAVGPFLQHAGLSQVLIFIYVIIAAYGAGYMVIAHGARKLARIEEVVG